MSRLGLSIFLKSTLVPINIFNGCPDTRLITTTSFFVATSTQNYTFVLSLHTISHTGSSHPMNATSCKKLVVTRPVSSKNTQERQEHNENSLHRTQLLVISISCVVFLLFLCEFFLSPFVSAGTRYQFCYPANRSLTGTR